jgi:hypothetical protein
MFMLILQAGFHLSFTRLISLSEPLLPFLLQVPKQIRIISQEENSVYYSNVDCAMRVLEQQYDPN